MSYDKYVQRELRGGGLSNDAAVTLAEELQRLSPESLSATYARAGVHATLHAIGDSITAAGLASAGPVWNNDRNPWAWAHLLSGGRLMLGTIAATGGYTSTQVKDTHLPTALAASREGDFIAVLCGTNDATIGDATAKANLLSMWQQIAAAGCQPVCCALTPRATETATAVGNLVRFNKWIERTARENGWRFLDFFAATSDPTAAGAWKSGYASDNIHPAGPGAKAMGQLVASTLTPPDAPYPLLAAYNIGTGAAPGDGLLMLGNATMQSDSNADGAPDQFTSNSGTLSGGSAYALGTDANVLGKFFTVTRGATGPTDVTAKTATISGVVPGRRYYLAFKLKFVPVSAASFMVARLGNTTEAIIVAGITTGNNWKTAVDTTTFATEFVCPDLGGDNTLAFKVQARGGECSVSVGQLTLIDLTAQALA